MSETRRDTKVDIRLSLQEKDALLAAAAKARRTVSDYARPRLLRGLKIETEESQAALDRAAQGRA